MRSLLSLTLAGLAAELAHAIPNSSPEPTLASENVYDALGWTPAPTDAPSLELLKRGVNQNLAARDLTSGQLIGYFAPDSMCGYISGSVGASIPCSSASKCAAIAPVGGSPGAVGCCASSGSGCYFITTCYDYAAYTAGKCDHGCQQDVDVRICTASTRPYCYGYTWPDISATIWGCDSTSVNTMDKVQLTFNGETDSKTWKAAYYTPSDSSSATGILSAFGQASSKSSATSSTNSPVVTTSAAAKSSTNVGAIVGGVIGGLAVLGATAFGVIFLLLRKRKNKKNAPALENTPAPFSPAPTSQTPYDPNAGTAAAGFYGQQDNKPGMQQTSPYQSPPQPYLAAGQPKYDPNNQYHDNRVSTLSEATHSPVPPYQPPAQAYGQGPMEMDGTSSMQPGAHGAHGAYGQPIYEAPTNNK